MECIYICNPFQDQSVLGLILNYGIGWKAFAIFVITYIGSMKMATVGRRGQVHLLAYNVHQLVYIVVQVMLITAAIRQHYGLLENQWLIETIDWSMLSIWLKLEVMLLAGIILFPNTISRWWANWMMQEKLSSKGTYFAITPF